jgi:hypothetical protein
MMQELDIRYAFILFPLIYIIIPYFLSGSFLLLGGLSVFVFITTALIFIVITNLHIGGNAGAVTVNTGFSLSLSPESGYSLFVIFMGGIFYLGAQLTLFVTPILNIFTSILDTVLGVVGWVFGFDSAVLQTNLGIGVSSLSTNLDKIYPLNIKLFGYSVFGTLDVIFGLIYIVGLYFMVSSRGK